VVIGGALNGRPAVRFDGQDDLLQAKFSLAQPTTLLIVYKVRTNNGTNQYVADGALNGAMVHYVNGSVFGIYAGGGTVLVRPSFSFGTFHVVGAVFAGASSALYADGGPPATGNPGSASPGGITIGNSGSNAAPAAADVAEVALYDRALAPADIDGVGRYLAAKYGLGWTPVT